MGFPSTPQAGGTALAIKIGHRQSIDFDFFTNNEFNTKGIINYLVELGNFELYNEAKNTINGLLNNVKISFFTYPYRLIRNPDSYLNLLIANIYDIALMKLEAISGRGSKKDFIDLFFLLKHFSLSELFKGYENKFGMAISNHYHLLKSLVYFEDAEHQLMPKMLINTDWENVKSTVINIVKNENRQL